MQGLDSQKAAPIAPAGSSSNQKPTVITYTFSQHHLPKEERLMAQACSLHPVKSKRALMPPCRPMNSSLPCLGRLSLSCKQMLQAYALALKRA